MCQWFMTLASDDIQTRLATLPCAVLLDGGGGAGVVVPSVMVAVAITD